MEKLFGKYTNLHTVNKTVKASLIPTEATKRFIVSRDYINKANTLKDNVDFIIEYHLRKKHAENIDRALISIMKPVVFSEKAFNLDDAYQKYLEKLSDTQKLSEYKQNIINKMHSALGFNDKMCSSLNKDLKSNFKKEKNVNNSDFQKWNASINQKYGVNTNSVCDRLYTNMIIYFNNLHKINNLDKDAFSNFSSYEYIGSPEKYSAYINADGIKAYNETVAAFNQKCNEYVQKYNSENKGEKPAIKAIKLKKMYNMILFGEESVYEYIKDDEDFLEKYNNLKETFLNDTSMRIDRITDALSSYDFDILEQRLKGLSKKVYGDAFLLTNVLKLYIENDIKAANPNIKKTALKKLFKAKYGQSFSISIIETALKEYLDDAEEANKLRSVIIEDIIKAKNEIITILNKLEIHAFPNKQSIKNSEKVISDVDALFDNIRTINSDLKFFNGGDTEEVDNCIFKIVDNNENTIINTLDGFCKFGHQWNTYVLQKPYSIEKIPIKFDIDNERIAKSTTDDEYPQNILFEFAPYEYYFCKAINKNVVKEITNSVATCDEESVKLLGIVNILPQDNFNKQICRLPFIKEVKEYFDSKLNADNVVPDDVEPYVIIKESYIKEFVITPKIYNIYNSNNKDDKNSDVFINFAKDFLKCHKSFRPANLTNILNKNYTSWNEFCKDVEKCCANCPKTFEFIKKSKVLEMINNGSLLAFRINTMGLSNMQKGKNDRKVNTKLIVSAFSSLDSKYSIHKPEEFFRKASIKDEDKIVHKKGVEISHKRDNGVSLFDFDIIKDRRFTKDSYLIHIPLEYKVLDTVNVNDLVLKDIENDCFETALGIDLGERNFVSYTLINIKTKEIINQGKFKKFNGFDYEKQISELIKERKKEQREKKAIKHSIARLKDDYKGHVVNEIVKMVFKYKAVVVFEKLSDGFKQTRRCKMKDMYDIPKRLITKLNMLILKDVADDDIGGLNNPLQLAYDNIKTKQNYQNGIIFFVNPSYTSNIDPTTGFVDFFSRSQKNMSDNKDLLKNLDIKWDDDENTFTASFDYKKCKKHLKGNKFSGKSEWTVYYNVDRIIHHKFKCNSANHTDETPSHVAEQMLNEVLTEYNIDKHTPNLSQVLIENCSAENLNKVVRSFLYVLQMRNRNDNNDFILSPVKNKDGVMFDTRLYTENDKMPYDSDSNGSYHIALKYLMPKSSKKETVEPWIKFMQNTVCI